MLSVRGRREKVKKEACSKIEDFLASSAEVSAWEKDYFALHRDRYGICLDDVDRSAEDGRVLEVGSVPCHFTVLLKLSGYDVIGVDPHPERARQIMDRFSLDVVKRDIEAERLPFADSSFKTIIFSEVLEHMYIDPLSPLSELARVLSPGGKLLLYTDNLYSLRTFRRFLSGEGITDAVKEWDKLRTIGHRGHIRLYSAKEVRGLLALVGLTAIQSGYYHYNEIKSLRSSMIYKVLPGWLSPNQLIIATKNA